MERKLAAIPWFLAAPGVALATLLVAAFGYIYVGDLFVQTCANEVNLLTGEVEAGCGDDGDSPAAPTPSDGTGSVVLKGQFQDGDPGHDGEGTAEIQRLGNGNLNLRLGDFSVTSGPDLFVYLAKEADGDPVDFINLGKLTANNGSQNYAIPAGTMVENYRRVIIWCRQFGVNFAFANLGEPGMDMVSMPSGSTPAPQPTGANDQLPLPTTAAPSTPAAGTAIPSPATVPASPASATPTVTPLPRATATLAGPGVLSRGTFVDGDPGHFGSGTAEVQRLADGSLNLRLANFSVTSGPDLIVYLSPSADDYVTGGINLGELKANNGNQNYAIPAGTDLSGVKSVVIWCKSFPTVFAYATLEVN